jgi:glyoxylase-like metal-dependent hydrolase (beta-lactamase superfamily II)
MNPPLGRLSGILLLLGAALTTAEPAQTNPYRLERLADGVYAVIRDQPPGGFADSNVLFIVNEHDVVVVDANIFPTSARQVIGEIKKITPLPVRYVINTHWHADHQYGNHAYLDAYPEVEFVQHINTRADALAKELPSIEKNVKTEYPAIVARLERALETGKTSTGAEVTADMRASFTVTLAQYKLFIADMSVTRMIPGTLTVSDSLVLHRGERTIVVRYLGKGNTSGDLVVHLPKERIVATGDLVVLPVPFAFYSNIGDWAGTLRVLKTLDTVAIMPGHGEIQRDWAYVDQLIPLLESTWSQVQRAVAGGASLEATLRAVNLDAFRGGFTGSRGTFDELFLRPAVTAAFEALSAAPR